MLHATYKPSICNQAWVLTATRLGNAAKLKVYVDYLVRELQQGRLPWRRLGLKALDGFG